MNLLREINLIVIVSLLCSACSAKKSAAPMSPSDMEAAWRVASEPGESHTYLEPLYGKWNTETRFWKKQGGEPDISHGMVNTQWIFGNRFLKENYMGDLDGFSFNGLGITGYDNLKKQFTSFWIDSMNTGCSLWYGDYDPGTKTFHYTGSEIDPFTKVEHSTRSTLTVLDKDTHRFELFREEDGGFVKTMEVTYKRAS